MICAPKHSISIPAKVNIFFITAMIVFLLLPCSVFAQFDFTKEEKSNAAAAIQQLRASVLVVRLKTKQRQVQAYREAGKTAIASKIEQKALKENLEIISGCIKYFNFAKVYFVNTEDIEYFRKTDRLVLSNLLPLKDSVITLNHDSVFYLDYGFLYGRQRVNEWTYKDYDNSIENSQIISENAFVIRDSKDKQLSPPLPFYKIAIGNRLSKTITQLNNHLIGFYNKATNQELYSLEYWNKNNPNAAIYSEWKEIQRKIQSLKEATPQFVQPGQ